MKRAWIFFENPIDNATRNSNVLGVRISNFHDSALQEAAAVAFFNTLYSVYHPIHLVFIAAYNAWASQGDNKQGETLNLKQLLELLSSTKIDFWDSAIKVVYASTTPRYKALLTKGHKPFQTSSQSNRILAVKTLSDNIGADAALATVKADVDAFYTLINNANSTQKGSKSNTTILSQNLEAARIMMCVAQYANLGLLINHFAATPLNCEPFFDLEALRESKQIIFTGHVSATKTHLIVKRTFAINTHLALKNTGNASLTFFFAATKDATNATIMQQVNPHSEFTINTTTIGNTTTNHFLLVMNTDAPIRGEYEVEVV